MMRRLIPPAAAAMILLVPASGYAQQQVPNPMAAHTLFVVLITAAFLVWAASYSLHFNRDREDRHKLQRQAVANRREALLDEITDIETAYESGKIGEARYRNRMKTLRRELARTIGKLEAAGATTKKPPSAGRRRA